jgi:PEP-CTERM motif
MKMLFAAALVLVGLLPASAADADIIVTSALRQVIAQEELSTPDQDSSTATSGLFNETASVTSEGRGANATQNSNIQPVVLEGLSTTAVQTFVGGTGLQARSLYRVFFSLTEPHQVTGTVGVQAAAFTTASALAQFTFTSIGPGPNLFFNAFGAGADGGPINLFLDPGNFSVEVRAEAAIPSQVGTLLSQASFGFELVFTPEAQTAVPEPATLSLLLLGGAGVAAMKRRHRRR